MRRCDELPFTLFLTAFGVLVGVWIQRVTHDSDERARLIEEPESSRAQVAELSRRAGAAAERERLAGEIHDTLAQGFTSIVTLLQARAGRARRRPAHRAPPRRPRRPLGAGRPAHRPRAGGRGHPRRRSPRPVLGAGERLLDGLGGLAWEPVEVIASPSVTHVRYRIQP